jgi:hypothetical protein
MKNQNPAQDAQSKEVTFMENQLKDFTDFVIESMGQGHHENFKDHFEFMKASMEVYLENENDTEEEL